MVFFRIFAGLFLLSFVSTIIIYFTMPSWHPYLVAEDNLTETATAAFFAGACIASFFFLLFPRNREEGHKRFLVLTGVSWLGFMDEISFGERIFDMKMPELDGVKIDAAHDFIYIVAREYYRVFKYYGIIIPLLTAGFALLCLAIAWYFREYVIRTAQFLYGHQTLRLLSCSVILVGTAQIIDLDIIHSPLLQVIEEQFEMSCALALVFASFSLHHSIDNRVNLESEDSAD